MVKRIFRASPQPKRRIFASISGAKFWVREIAGSLAKGRQDWKGDALAWYAIDVSFQKQDWEDTTRGESCWPRSRFAVLIMPKLVEGNLKLTSEIRGEICGWFGNRDRPRPARSKGHDPSAGRFTVSLQKKMTEPPVFLRKRISSYYRSSRLWRGRL